MESTKKEKLRSMKISEDTYWFLARYAAIKKFKRHRDVLRKWTEIMEQVPENRLGEILFSSKTREGLELNKVIKVEDEVYWKLKGFVVKWKMHKLDDAIFNIIGFVQALEGDW